MAKAKLSQNSGMYEKTKRRMAKTMLGMAGLGMLKEAARPDANKEEKLRAMEPFFTDLRQWAELGGIEKHDLKRIYRDFGSLAKKAISNIDSRDPGEVYRGIGKALANVAAAAILEEATKSGVSAEEMLREMGKYMDAFVLADTIGLDITDGLNDVFQALGADIFAAEALYTGEPPSKPSVARKASKTAPRVGKKEEYTSLSRIIHYLKNRKFPYNVLKAKLLADPGAEGLLVDYGRTKKGVAKENVAKVEALLRKYKEMEPEVSKPRKPKKEAPKHEYASLSNVVLQSSAHRKYRSVVQKVLADPESRELVEATKMGYRVHRSNVQKLQQRIRGYDLGDEIGRHTPQPSERISEEMPLSKILVAAQSPKHPCSFLRSRLLADPKSKGLIVERGKRRYIKAENLKEVNSLIRGYRGTVQKAVKKETARTDYSLSTAVNYAIGYGGRGFREIRQRAANDSDLVPYLKKAGKKCSVIPEHWNEVVAHIRGYRAGQIPAAASSDEKMMSIKLPINKVMSRSAETKGHGVDYFIEKLLSEPELQGVIKQEGEDYQIPSSKINKVESLMNKYVSTP